MKALNLANKLDRGEDSGKLRSKVDVSSNQLNQQILPNFGSVGAVRAGVYSLCVAFINGQLSDALERISAIFGKRLKNAEATHPILMCFSQLSGIWHCCFFEDACKTQRLQRRLTFRDSAKLLTAAKHGNADLNSSESQQNFENDIRLGRGAIWLRMSDEQIATLSK